MLWGRSTAHRCRRSCSTARSRQSTAGVKKMATYVLVHGAWHSGRELKAVATLLGSAGHTALTPTILGNGPEDPKTVGLDEAIHSIEAYVLDECSEDVILVGHSFGG